MPNYIYIQVFWICFTIFEQIEVKREGFVYNTNFFTYLTNFRIIKKKPKTILAPFLKYLILVLRKQVTDNKYYKLSIIYRAYHTQPKTLGWPLKACRLNNNDQNWTKFWFWNTFDMYSNRNLNIIGLSLQFFVKVPQYNTNARAPHAQRVNLA